MEIPLPITISTAPPLRMHENEYPVELYSNLKGIHVNSHLSDFGFFKAEHLLMKVIGGGGNLTLKAFPRAVQQLKSLPRVDIP